MILKHFLINKYLNFYVVQILLCDFVFNKHIFLKKNMCFSFLKSTTLRNILFCIGKYLCTIVVG